MSKGDVKVMVYARHHDPSHLETRIVLSHPCSLLGKHDCWPQDSLSEQIQIVIAINRPDETVNTAIYNLSVYHIAMVTVNDIAMIL